MSSDDYIDRLGESSDEEWKRPTRAICDPTLDYSEIVDLCIKSICTEGIQFSITNVTDTRPIAAYVEYNLTSIDNVPEGVDNGLEVGLDNDQRLPLSFLTESIKRSGLPLFVNFYDNSWLAWDTNAQRLRTGPSPAFLKVATNISDFKKDERKKIKPGSSNEKLLQFMKRCALSTDHGKKPLVVHRDNIDDVFNKRPINIEHPRTIGPNEHQNYVLAFHDTSGAVRLIPLSAYVELGVPVHTRNGTYYEGNNSLYPNINEASLLAHSFIFATKANLCKLDYFRIRSRGSVFDSVIERIEPPSFSKYEKNPDEPNKFLDLARFIAQWSSSFEERIFVTNSGHPLDSETVTTPELLLKAFEELDDHEWVRDVRNDALGSPIMRKCDISNYGILNDFCGLNW